MVCGAHYVPQIIFVDCSEILYPYSTVSEVVLVIMLFVRFNAHWTCARARGVCVCVRALETVWLTES